MTRGETTAAVVTVAALAGVAAWSLYSGGSSPGLGASVEITADAPACPRHGLYRRFDGHAARQALTQPGGWLWFSQPPEAKVL